ncbi:hypothetical protein IQ238_20680 [Pleurocapsales cyanobacterium LEGE 06147]|nr:hypothetical protein [Pleurocapsales cyanobacterium LEGE 06147]
MSLAQRIRDNVVRSRRTTSEILGAASVLVQGHERILQQLNVSNTSMLSFKWKPWTVAAMKSKIGEFRVAKNHFLNLYGVKARSWSTLVEKVNTIEAALIHLGYWQPLETTETLERDI